MAFAGGAGRAIRRWAAADVSDLATDTLYASIAHGKGTCAHLGGRGSAEHDRKRWATSAARSGSARAATATVASTSCRPDSARPVASWCPAATCTAVP